MKISFDKNNQYSCCALCDEKILFYNPDKSMNTKNYNEILFETSVPSVMRVGFCNKCYETAKKDSSLYKIILDSVIEGWEQEMLKDNWKDEEVEKYRKWYQPIKILRVHNG
jgi:hypothetical protein